MTNCRACGKNEAKCRCWTVRGAEPQTSGNAVAQEHLQDAPPERQPEMTPQEHHMLVEAFVTSLKEACRPNHGETE